MRPGPACFVVFATLLSSASMGAESVRDLDGAIIPPEHSDLVKELLTPYWGHGTPELTIGDADIQRTYVHVNVQTGHARTDVYLLSPADKVTAIKPAPTERVANDRIVIAWSCPACAVNETATLKKLADSVLTNSTAHESLWTTVPRPEAGRHRRMIWGRVAGVLLLVLAFGIVAWRRAKTRQQPNRPV
jgi:hypothetical protein